MQRILSIVTFFICSISSVMADTFMTDAEKFSSVQYTVFKKTLFTQYDYKSDESIKAFEEYDFTVESAPCTAIGESYSVDDDDNTIYTIEVSNKSFQFMCRKVAKMDGKEMRRLYLIGSAYDCVSRSFDYSTSPVEQYRALGESCKKENRESVQKVVDYSYLEAFILANTLVYCRHIQLVNMPGRHQICYLL